MIGVIFKGVGSVIVMAKTDEVPILDSESALHWPGTSCGNPASLVVDTRKTCPPQARLLSVTRTVFDASLSMPEATSITRFEYWTTCPLMVTTPLQAAFGRQAKAVGIWGRISTPSTNRWRDE